MEIRMAAQRLKLVAPSGNRVDVDLPASPGVSSIAASVRFVGGSYGTGFQIGPRGYHDFACTYVAPATLRERIVVHGREVVIAEAHDKQSSVATLIGAYHELMTVFAGPAPKRDRVAALFGALKVQDHVDGMAVQPQSATLLDNAVENIVVVVKSRGTLNIPGPRQARALTPAHAGARIAHGEVWKTNLSEAEHTVDSAMQGYLLGFPAGVAELHLANKADSGSASEATLLGWLNEINVAWRAAA
jgi:hypothetical protein